MLMHKPVGLLLPLLARYQFPFFPTDSRDFLCGLNEHILKLL